MKAIYWTTTSLVAALLLLSAASYLLHKGTIDGVRALGFPDFFRVQLAALKIIGALVILAPGLPLMVKEWAYAGIALFLLTAVVAHTAHKDPIGLTLLNAVFAGLLVVSHVLMHRLAVS